MQLNTNAFADNGAIPGECAFAVIDPATHVRLSANGNPDFAWSGVARRHALAGDDLPRPRRALAGRRRQPGRPRGAGVAAARRLLPLGADRPPAPTAAIARGELSDGVTARGKPGPDAPREARHGTQRLHRLVRRRQGDGRRLLTATTARARRGTTRSRTATFSRSTRSTCARLAVQGFHRCRRARCDGRPRPRAGRRHRPLHAQSGRAPVASRPREPRGAPRAASPRRRSRVSQQVSSGAAST